MSIALNMTNNNRKSKREHPEGEWGWMSDFKILKQYL